MHCNLCTHLLLFWYTYLILKLEVLDDEVGDLEDDIDIVGEPNPRKDDSCAPSNQQQGKLYLLNQSQFS